MRKMVRINKVHRQSYRTSPSRPSNCQYLIALQSALVGSRAIPMVLIIPTPATHLIATISPKMDGTLGTNAFFYPLLGSMMIDTEHERLTNFLKLKPLLLQGLES